MGYPLEPALQDIRQREGATAERLNRRMTEDPSWKTVADSPFTAALVAALHRDPATCWIEYMKVVLARLDSDDATLLDMVLALQVDRTGTYASGDYDNNLEARRNFAVKASNATSPRVNLTEPILRTRREPAALRKLASALNQPKASDIIALGADARAFADFVEEPILATPTAKVVVIGLAVEDLIFRVPTQPEPGTSVQALTFTRTPGGKGLTQAVGCARLEMDTALISVIGDDPAGHAITAFLRAPENRVDTGLLITEQDASTAVTASSPLPKPGPEAPSVGRMTANYG